MDPLDRLCRLRTQEERLAVGLMSGMSLDGLDLALVRIRARPTPPLRQVDLVSTHTEAYSAGLSDRIRHTVLEGTTRDVCLLSFELAAHWADLVLAFLEAAGVEPGQVDLLGSHGQTIDHVARSPGADAATLQIGDGDVLAERTGILTVSDFRSRDVAAGGEGAPLVPLADWLLYARADETTACQNLGSIANATVVTPRREEVRAFDTGPANALIDAFARLETGGPGFDRDGQLSARGQVDPAVLAALYAASGAFLHRPPPRSAGFDDFGPALAARIREAYAGTTPIDLVRTAVEFTARTLAEAYERWIRPGRPDLRRVLVTGGGARNPTLIARIRARLAPLGLEVEIPPEAWADMKEAVAFALLADETVGGRPGNLPGATGARQAVVLGKISL